MEKAAERIVILDLGDVLSIRLECNKCETAVAIKPTDWRHPPFVCPTCQAMWEVPNLPDQELTPTQRFGLGLRQILENERATAQQGGVTPYRVRVEVSTTTYSGTELDIDVLEARAELEQVRRILNADLKIASERVLTLELENQRLHKDADVARTRLLAGLQQLREKLRREADALDSVWKERFGDSYPETDYAIEARLRRELAFKLDALLAEN